MGIFDSLAFGNAPFHHISALFYFKSSAIANYYRVIRERKFFNGRRLARGKSISFLDATMQRG